MMLLTRRIISQFSKMSRPKPKPNKQKQEGRQFAASDDKAAKLSKSEQQLENKAKFIAQEKIEEQTRRKLELFKKHDPTLQQYMTKQQLDLIYTKQLLYLKGISRKVRVLKKQKPKEQYSVKFEYLPSELTKMNKKTGKSVKINEKYGNFTKQVNKRYSLTQFQGNQQLRRVGTLGIKLGMTTLWDRWGHVVAATVIQLDRSQIVQIKKPVRNNQFYQVQIGCGAANLKKLNKPLMGHFLKSRVPPKQHMSEFRVSQQCLLPVGYMISARHYTPGMFVDVTGKTVGHGFQGTIKRYRFKRQPSSHGNSLTTRVLGSTGGRQDPGRVFKKKRMYGRMGGKTSVQWGIPVFKIDVQKNIIYLRGSVPGKAGTIVKIRDTLLHAKCQQNLKLSHFPTFVEEKGKQYARQMTMYCGQRDSAQIQLHDNAYILDDGQDLDAATTTSKDAIPQE